MKDVIKAVFLDIFKDLVTQVTMELLKDLEAEVYRIIRKHCNDATQEKALIDLAQLIVAELIDGFKEKR